MNEINQNRRKWLSLGGIILSAALLPQSVLAVLPKPSKSKFLSFRNINTGERFRGEFFANKGFSSSDLKKIDHLMRDKRNNQIHKMDPKLFHKFVHIQNNLGLQNSEIQIICGYRSPASNSAMLRSGRGVARNSYHTRGQAIDFRIEGVSLAKLRQTAENLKNGGVGYYPRSNFIHVDTGPVRTWRGS
ncbi:YcbK family protein [Histophilus somni]|uniref:YcbK family protein n=1 Tax=Histophilus somni TaxID=731 RepID=UPI0000397702|nr:YcbK family protein [Histophilus somni]ACA31316.1 protein of unknown function DUF882 [Histophilus somni 2336]QQF85345.1 YcbK family protein [Histophilus somni]QQJ90841.1 YcbK family protein [Histophilus somni]